MSEPVSCREQLVVRLYDRLSAIVGLAVERNRRDALGEDELNRLILFEDDVEGDETLFISEDGYGLPVAIQVAVPGGSDAASRLNAVRAQVIQALYADGHTLGGLARDVRLDNTGNWIGVPAPDGAEGFILGATIVYATVADDPYTFA